MAREFGQQNPDGTVSVIRENDDGSFTTLRTESVAQNQGLAPAPSAPTAQSPVSTINALTNALSGLSSSYGGMTGNIEPTASLTRQSNEAIAAMQGVTARLGLGVNLYSQQNQMAMQVMQQAYLRERMRLLELPEMRNADERARAGIALDAATQLAAATGWINPQDYQKIIAMQMKVLENTGQGDLANDFWASNPELKAMYDKLQGQAQSNYDWTTGQLRSLQPGGGGGGGGGGASGIDAFASSLGVPVERVRAAMAKTGKDWPALVLADFEGV